jgi:hypothetical protein
MQRLSSESRSFDTLKLLDGRFFRRTHMNFFFSFLILLGSCFSCASGSDQPELVVTGIFIAENADVDAAFVENAGRDLAMFESSRLVELLKETGKYNVHADFMENPASSISDYESAGDRVYVRCTVTRADLKTTEYFAGFQLWTFSLGLRLEFFDIQSGQVYYGRSFTSRIPVESATEIDREFRSKTFSEAFKSALENCVTQSSSEYSPGRLKCEVVDLINAEKLIISAGRADGLLTGSIVELYAAESRWMAKLIQIEDKFSLAKIVAGSTSDLPPLGAAVKINGINSSTNNPGPAIMVSGVVPGTQEAIDEWFDVDNSTMGQWLHDALVDTKSFNMLPPLLSQSKSDDGINGMATAFFQAQATFSAFGDVSQDEIIGQRTFPDVLVRGTVINASNQISKRLGFWAQTLSLGIMIEFYDRKTREVLLTVSHENHIMEKSNDKYRKADLAAAWRTLTRNTIHEAALLAEKRYQPAKIELQLKSITNEELLFSKAKVPIGTRTELKMKSKEIKNLQGEVLGSLYTDYAIAEVLSVGTAGVMAKIIVGNAEHKPAVGDLMTIRKATDLLPNAQVRSITIGGAKVNSDYSPDKWMISNWLHRELGENSIFNMLPGENLAAEVAAAEVALAMGEFKAVDLSEIILQDEPQPAVYVDVRVGLARWESSGDKYKQKIEFSVGVELAFFDSDNKELIFTKDRKGEATNKVKRVQAIVDEQILSNGKIVQGPLESEFFEKLDICLELCLKNLVDSVDPETLKLN